MLTEFDQLLLLKLVEVLPRCFIFIVKYSVCMVDGGNFCSKRAIQKWKGCGWREPERKTHIGLHGSQMSGCWLLMGDCVWCLRTCLLKGDAIQYPYLYETDIHMPHYAEDANINCRLSSVLVIMPSCMSKPHACLNVECGLTELWPLRKKTSE